VKVCRAGPVVIAKSVGDEAIHSFPERHGLLPRSLVELRRTSRFARNDDVARAYFSPSLNGSSLPDGTVSSAIASSIATIT